jgi:hypothetical protein
MRAETTDLVPEARVTGAVPAKALRPRASVKSFAGVADLAEHPGAQDGAQPGHAGDDLGVGVGVERFGDGVVERGEVVQRGAQESEQASSLFAHRGLDERRLVQLFAAQVRQDR